MSHYKVLEKWAPAAWARTGKVRIREGQEAWDGGYAGQPKPELWALGALGWVCSAVYVVA